MKINIDIRNNHQELRRISVQLDSILERLNLMATQTDIDNLTAQLTTVGEALNTAVVGIQADLDALKAANPAVDITALSASVEALVAASAAVTAIDAENPAPPVA